MGVEKAYFCYEVRNDFTFKQFLNANYSRERQRNNNVKRVMLKWARARGVYWVQVNVVRDSLSQTHSTILQTALHDHKLHNLKLVI